MRCGAFSSSTTIRTRYSKAFRSRNVSGDFAFSPAALESLTERAGEFVVAGDDTPGARRFTRLDPQLSNVGSLRVLVAERAFVVLFAGDEGLKLVFWENVTALAQ